MIDEPLAASIQLLFLLAAVERTVEVLLDPLVLRISKDERANVTLRR